MEIPHTSAHSIVPQFSDATAKGIFSELRSSDGSLEIISFPVRNFSTYGTEKRMAELNMDAKNIVTTKRAVRHNRRYDE